MTAADLDHRLASIGLDRASAGLVALLPLVQVAWADGSVAPEERAAILAIARQRRLGTSPVLERWLTREPAREAMIEGQRLVVALAGRTDEPRLDRSVLDEIVAWCGGVAEAAGGLFGYARVSPAERAAIDEIDRALHPADAGWECLQTATRPDDVALYSRDVPGAPLKAFRGVSHADAPIERVVGLLLDFPLMTRWLFRGYEARSVARTGHEQLVYLAVSGIWPLDDRDAVIRVVPSIDATTSDIVFEGTAAPDAVPEVPGRVRIPAITSSWRVRTVSHGTRLDWQGLVDPNGAAPPWLVNMTSTQVPKHAMRRVQAMLADGTVGAAHEAAGRACLAELGAP